MKEAALVILATSALAYLLTRADVLEKPRLWIVLRSRFFGELATCGYCLSHWIAAAFVLGRNIRLFGLWPPIDYLLTILVIAFLASIVYAATAWLIEELYNHREG